MKRMKLGMAMASGILAGVLAWAATTSPVQDSYVKIDAASLVSTPQSAWARAILFSDAMETLPAGRVQRLDRKDYLAMKLKSAGTVWVPEELAPKFQTLRVGDTYSFAGTVDQISRRYYIIVDACYRIQTLDNVNEQWTDMLHAPERALNAAPDATAGASMQALLIEAQNHLVKMAKESNLSVAQLIEGQTDGGQRIAEIIVADALQGELKEKNKTAEELMIGSVLALLQKQAVLDESAKIASENAALPETLPDPAPVAAEAPPVEVAAVVEEVAIEPIDPPTTEPPPPPSLEEELAAAPDTAAADPEVAVVEKAIPGIEPETMAPAIAVADAEPPAPEMTAELPDGAGGTALAAPSEDEPKAEKPKKRKKKSAEEKPAVEMAVLPVLEPMEAFPPMAGPAEAPPAEAIDRPSGPTVEEEIEAHRAAEWILPAGAEPGAEPIAAPPTSMLVVPLTENQQEMIPLVSVQPTKAELAMMKKQAAVEERERELAAKKAAAEEADRQYEADRLARIEAKRLAAMAKKAEKEARLAEIVRQRAEEQRVREEAAARKAAEWKAKQETLQAEAAAKKAMEAEAKRLALEEKQALEAVRQTEILEKQAAAVRAMREETEKRLAEMAARKEAAEAAMRELEEQKAASLKKLHQEAEAQSAFQAAELNARIAAEEASRAESIRIAQEVTAHEKTAGEDAAARIAAESAARKEVEAKLKKLEEEVREMEAKMGKSGGTKPTPPEAIGKAKAKAKTEKATKEAVDSGDLPEWMQPVQF
ncbi:MAG: hypothetical protein EOM72_00565 [Opitutae bacterium]|nr:hypothetical protein [Opitutae bacterium]